MWTHLKPALLALLILAVTSAPTELNLYISKEHLADYYNISMDDKVLVLHKRQNHVSSNHHLTFANGTELPPFPESVNNVTFTWLATEKEEVTYSIGLQEDLQGPPLLLNPTISISDNGLVPENRSTFDIGLPCANLASGIAQVGVNLSFHYHDDNFNLSVFFFIEKQCTDGTPQGDRVQPTEVLEENTRTLEGSDDLSAVGRVDESLVSIGSPLPITTVGSQSIHGNTVTIMSSSGPITYDQSETTILPPVSSATGQLSSMPLPRSDASFTLPVTISSSISLESVSASFITSDIFTSVSATSSELSSSTVSVLLSTVPSMISETPSEFINPSSTMSSATAVVVLSNSLTDSTGLTSLFGIPVTSMVSLKTTSPIIARTVLLPSVSHEDSSVFISSSKSIPVPSISVTLSPSVLSQGVNSTLPGSSIPASSFTPIFSTSAVISIPSSLISETVSDTTSQSERTSSVQISSSVFPPAVTTSPVVSSVQDISTNTETPSSSQTTLLPASSLSTNNVSLTPSMPTAVTSVVSPSSMLSSSTKVVPTSSSDLGAPSESSSSVSQTATTTAITTSVVRPSSSSSVSSKSLSTSTTPTGIPHTPATAVPSASTPLVVNSTTTVYNENVTSSVTLSTTISSPSSTVGVTSSTNDTNEASLTLIIIVAATTSALITICIMLICIIVAMTCHRKKKPRRRRRSLIDSAIRIEFNSPDHGGKYKEEDNIGPPSASTSLRWGSIRNLSKPAQKLVVQLAVDRESLEMLETIKKGEYGWLVKASVTAEADNDADLLPTHQSVLVKMITGLGLGTKACGSCEEVSEFLDQATLLRGISHRNVLSVMGLCSDNHQAPIVIYSYPSIGSLHTFLTAHRQATSATRQKGPVTPKVLMDLCIQLAEAMKHLECFRIIHPDLQLRTCYLDEGYTLKLSDGALMSDFYPECYHVVYGAQRPVRWSALETLQGGLCTLHSNVWSFGITIWEIITMGDFPYSEVTNRNVLAHVMLGSRLEQPHDCPNELYEMMCNCWHTIPRHRPMFIQIASDLINIAKLYNSDDEAQAPSPDSALFHKQQELSSSSQAFHYNDKDMSYLLNVPITESDGVSITFSALGSTENLDEAGKGFDEDSNKRDIRSSVAVTTETSSSICSPEEAISPIPHISVAPPDIPYVNEQQLTASDKIPLRTEPPVNKFLLKPNGSRESTPDYRYSMSSDSQYSSSQFSSDASDNSRQQLLRYKRDSPEKRTTTIAEHSHKNGKDSYTDSNDSAVPSMESEMLSELMVSFDQRLTDSTHQ